MSVPQGYTIDKPSVVLPPGYTLDSATPQPAAAPPQQHGFWDSVLPDAVTKGWDTLTGSESTNSRPGVLGHIETGAHNILGRTISTAASPFLHPIDTLQSMAESTPPGQAVDMLLGRKNPMEQRAQEAASEWKSDPALAVENALGDVAGTYVGGKAVEGAVKGVPAAADYIQDKAIGNRDASALRGFQEGPKSRDALSTIKDVQQARPYFQGVDNLADFQNKVPAVRQEIIQPYGQAINALGDNIVPGPDGPTTIRALEDERQQLSAQTRAIQEGGPEGIALAQQKGLTEAKLLARKQAVENSLYPPLKDAGIDPREIMSRFGAVSRLGEDVSGRSTLIQPDKPYGLSKLIPSPLEAGVGMLTHGYSLLGKIGEVPGALRDIAAGRFTSGNPTDVGMREAFGGDVGPKPDLGQLKAGSGGVSPIGSVGYPSADSAFSRTPVPAVSEPEMGSARPGVISVGPNGQAVFPRLMLGAPEAAPQLPASVLPHVLGEPHEFTAPYSPRTAGRLLDLDPQDAKPTTRKYGVKTGTSKGVLGSVNGEER
jgi:hypothetical protein